MFLMAAALSASPVTAQGLDSLGSRAAAMAAFVAVADDASAVVWNPAGLASGPFFNLQLDLGRSTDEPDGPLASGGVARRIGSTLVSVGTTPVGVAYYRITTSFAANPAVPGTGDRQNGRVRAHTLVTSHLGATVQQSIGDFLTLGATLKLVRGSVATATVEASSWEQAFDMAAVLEREGSTRGDLDLGAMFAAGRVRAGVLVRNVTEPSFGEATEAGGSSSAELDRHARVGVAWGDRWPGIAATIFSFDADLTRVAHPAGERRDVAAGAERWWWAQRLGLRGGVRASTVGDARPVASVGGSYAVRSGMFVDAFVARGGDTGRAWGLAARVTY